MGGRARGWGRRRVGAGGGGVELGWEAPSCTPFAQLRMRPHLLSPCLTHFHDRMNGCCRQGWSCSHSYPHLHVQTRLRGSGHHDHHSDDPLATFTLVWSTHMQTRLRGAGHYDRHGDLLTEPLDAEGNDMRAILDTHIDRQGGNLCRGVVSGRPGGTRSVRTPFSGIHGSRGCVCAHLAVSCLATSSVLGGIGQDCCWLYGSMSGDSYLPPFRDLSGHTLLPPSSQESSQGG